MIGYFLGKDKAIELKPLTKGHINDSYKVTTATKSYVLQKINNDVFKDVEKLQENIYRVTTHIRQKLAERNQTDIDRKVLTLIPTKEGKLYYKDKDDKYWRMTIFINDSYSYDNINPNLAYRAGIAFGDFQDMLSDLPGEPLYETIKNFHNMETRLTDFRHSVKLNQAGRLDTAKEILDEIEQRADEMCKAERLYREGKLPKRTNHCDTKVNNILFDADGNVLCVVDLDTVMPGYVLSDFGDFIRTGANNGQEDDKNINAVSVNLEIFEAYTKGYLEKANRFLTDTEVENLAFGAKLLTYMQTVRFFTDYLDGDKYYKIDYPEHNLVRTKAQLKLLKSMEANFDKMQKIVLKYSSRK